MHVGADGTRGRRKRSEIDMRGQVGLSGRAKRIRGLAATQRLQAVAEIACRWPVIKKQRAPRVREEAPGQRGNERPGRFVPFKDRTVGDRNVYSPSP